jgi:hypothetical protein
VTVMFPCFFGIPHGAIRQEKIKNLSGFAVKLYVALCHESERYRTRDLTRTVAGLIKLVGGAPNSHIKARRELKEVGLIEYEERGSDGFLFRLCNPETGRPWPVAAKEKVPYIKRSVAEPNTPAISELAHDKSSDLSTALLIASRSSRLQDKTRTAHRSDSVSSLNADDAWLDPAPLGTDFPYGTNTSLRSAPDQHRKLEDQDVLPKRIVPQVSFD